MSYFDVQHLLADSWFTRARIRSCWSSFIFIWRFIVKCTSCLANYALLNIFLGRSRFDVTQWGCCAYASASILVALHVTMVLRVACLSDYLNHTEYKWFLSDWQAASDCHQKQGKVHVAKTYHYAILLSREDISKVVCPLHDFCRLRNS